MLQTAGLLRASEEPSTFSVWALVMAAVIQGFVLQGFPEELIFRGWQMTAFQTRAVAATVASSTIFASIHLISNGGQQNLAERVMYLALPFGFAMTAGALMVVTRSLWAAVGVHGGVHVGFLVSALLGFGGGPALWLTVGAVYTALAVVLFMVARRHGQLDEVWAGPTR